MTKRERITIAFTGYNIIRGRVIIFRKHIDKNYMLWDFFRKIYGLRDTFGRNKIDMFQDFLTKIQTNQT